MTSYYESRVAVVIDAIFYAVLQRTAALELWRGKGAKANFTKTCAVRPGKLNRERGTQARLLTNGHEMVF